MYLSSMKHWLMKYWKTQSHQNRRRTFDVVATWESYLEFYTSQVMYHSLKRIYTKSFCGMVP